VAEASIDKVGDSEPLCRDSLDPPSQEDYLGVPLPFDPEIVSTEIEANTDDSGF